MSRFSRSRTALRYSVRFSRWSTGRPGFGVAAASSSRCSSQATSPSCVAASGCGTPAGGMAPARSFRTTFSHIAASPLTLLQIDRVEHDAGRGGRGLEARVVALRAVLRDDAGIARGVVGRRPDERGLRGLTRGRLRVRPRGQRERGHGDAEEVPRNASSGPCPQEIPPRGGAAANGADSASRPPGNDSSHGRVPPRGPAITHTGHFARCSSEPAGRPLRAPRHEQTRLKPPAIGRIGVNLVVPPPPFR